MLSQSDGPLYSLKLFARAQYEKATPALSASTGTIASPARCMQLSDVRSALAPDEEGTLPMLNSSQLVLQEASRAKGEVCDRPLYASNFGWRSTARDARDMIETARRALRLWTFFRTWTYSHILVAIPSLHYLASLSSCGLVSSVLPQVAPVLSPEAAGWLTDSGQSSRLSRQTATATADNGYSSPAGATQQQGSASSTHSSELAASAARMVFLSAGLCQLEHSKQHRQCQWSPIQRKQERQQQWDRRASTHSKRYHQ